MDKKVNIDNDLYSQWEHTMLTKKVSVDRTRDSSSAIKSVHASITSRTAESKRLLEPIKDAKVSRIRFLEAKCRSSKTALEKFKAHMIELSKANCSLRQLIEEDEKPGHENVKTLLRRYEKYRGGMSFLGENFRMTLAREKQSLQSLQLSLDSEINIIQREVDNLESQLKERIRNLHTLNNYKDKEYPVKAIQIADLIKELDQVEMVNEDDISELGDIVESELGKFRLANEKEVSQLRDHVLSKTLARMHPSLKDMAEQNQLMAAEIEISRKHRMDLEAEITDLKSQVDCLVKLPNTNLRMHVYPEFFNCDAPCTPDMDIVLDIPKSEFMIM